MPIHYCKYITIVANFSRALSNLHADDTYNHIQCPEKFLINYISLNAMLYKKPLRLSYAAIIIFLYSPRKHTNILFKVISVPFSTSLIPAVTSRI